jgi:hypothetical protein
MFTLKFVFIDLLSHSDKLAVFFSLDLDYFQNQRTSNHRASSPNIENRRFSDQSDLAATAGYFLRQIKPYSVVRGSTAITQRYQFTDSAARCILHSVSCVLLPIGLTFIYASRGPHPASKIYSVPLCGVRCRRRLNAVLPFGRGLAHQSDRQCICKTLALYHLPVLASVSEAHRSGLYSVNVAFLTKLAQMSG